LGFNVYETEKPNVFQIEIRKKRFRLNISPTHISQMKKNEFAFFKLEIFCTRIYYLMIDQGDMSWNSDINLDKENPLFFYDPNIQFDSLYDISGGCAKEIEDITPYLELIKQKMGDDEGHVQKKKKINITPYLELIERRMNE